MAVMSGPDHDDICRMAQNLARNCGYAVFPCRIDKTPACPHGFHDAATHGQQVAALWDRWPGELIGVATGARSNLDVLDVDPEHGDAFVWWQQNHSRLLPARVFRTRRRGLHLYFKHRDGMKNTQGKLARGVDTRGDGGYAIYWFAAGCECLDPTPPQPFPGWVFDALTYRPPPPPHSPRPPAGRGITGSSRGPIDGILRKLASAQEGERNGLLFWAACRLYGRGISTRDAEAMLLPIAIGIGLTDPEARRTIASARGRRAA
jgi:hypothetical protein